MANNKSAGLTLSQTKALISKLENEMAAFKKSYENIQTQLKKIESDTNSDGSKGLWSGRRAATWVKGAKKHCARDAQIYNNLADVVSALTVTYNNAKKVNQG